MLQSWYHKNAQSLVNTLIKSSNYDPSKSVSWKVLETVLNHLKSPQCTDMYSREKFSIVIFLPCVLMYQKGQISLAVGYKTAKPKTGHWE